MQIYSQSIYLVGTAMIKAVSFPSLLSSIKYAPYIPNAFRMGYTREVAVNTIHRLKS
jgi:hypothetical protein